jgi:hypothetical protein
MCCMKRGEVLVMNVVTAPYVRRNTTNRMEHSWRPSVVTVMKQERILWRDFALLFLHPLNFYVFLGYKGRTYIVWRTNISWRNV